MISTPDGSSGSLARPLARYIDHTLLKPDATEALYDELFAEAASYGFATVCVPPVFVRRAASALRSTAGSAAPVGVCTVVGFPLGYIEPEVRVFESERALEAGADELDTVINVSWLRSGQDERVAADLGSWVDMLRAESSEVVLKVIVETALLDTAEIERATRLVAASGADFVKTSTGFASRGATLEDVTTMRRTIDSLDATEGGALQIKASGGIRDRAAALAMIEAGADRLGTSSGVAIVGPLVARRRGGLPVV